jgi:NAD(P)-dependent dehydrogenase (short-subunit alcohol dehydrogenase family)
MEAEQVEAAVEATAKQFGRLDVLVNNAGGSKPRPFLDQRHSNWQRVINLNFTSMLAATQSASRHMIAGGRGGAIVNVASSEGFRAAPNYSVYAALKAGMIGFTKTMALELAEHGIRVNCIAPDGIDTPGISPREVTPAEDERRSRHIPLRRYATIEEAGTVIASLASNLMSYVTGVTVPVDGGIGAAGGWIKTDSGWGFGT